MGGQARRCFLSSGWDLSLRPSESTPKPPISFHKCRAAMAEPDEVHVIDWAPYGPSSGKLASFLSIGVKRHRMTCTPIQGPSLLGWRPSLLRWEAIAIRLEAIASRVEAIASRVEAIASRVEAIASRVVTTAGGFQNVAEGGDMVATRSRRVAVLGVHSYAP